MIKANFKISKTSKYDTTTNNQPPEDSNRNITQSEFEEFIIKSGAAGSFMVFRSDKKEDELGLDEL
jgi:hypothetical protein